MAPISGWSQALKSLVTPSLISHREITLIFWQMSSAAHQFGRIEFWILNIFLIFSTALAYRANIRYSKFDTSKSISCRGHKKAGFSAGSSFEELIFQSALYVYGSPHVFTKRRSRISNFREFLTYQISQSCLFMLLCGDISIKTISLFKESKSSE